MQYRALVKEDEFIEVFIDTPLEVCESQEIQKVFIKKQEKVRYQTLQGSLHLMKHR